MAAAVVALPKFVVMRSYYQTTKGYACYKSDNTIVLGEDDILSTTTKIAVEPATSDSKYVHLRFVYNNGYWARNVNDAFLNTASKQPEEDIGNPACTLFEPIFVASRQTVYFLHVQSGGRVRMNNPSTTFYVDDSVNTEAGDFIYVDWESLVKLPAHVAFRGDNDMYLRAATSSIGTNHLQFGSSNPNEKESGHEVSHMKDGRVQITSDLLGKMWWSKEDWVNSDWSPESDPESAVFTPVMIDRGSSTIALRSNGPYSGNNFCKRFSLIGIINALAPATPVIDEFSRLVVQELVQERTIYDAVYDLNNARIYNETPFVAGKAVLTNNTDKEATMAVGFTYQNEISYTFSRSVSLPAGVKTTFQVGVPLVENSQVVISNDMDINAVLNWGTAATITRSVSVSDSILVPAKSSVEVEYVGTKATFDVPFSYSQRDLSSTDGATVVTKQTDGIFTGANLYDFNFRIVV